MGMHVIDDDTMQELLRFVKAHHTWVRHNLVIRQCALEMGVILQRMSETSDQYHKDLENFHKAKTAKQGRKKVKCTRTP